MLQPLVLRLDKGSPLTAAEIDNNFKILRDGHNSLETVLFNVLDPDGTLKAGAVDNANVIADGIITAIKLAAGALVPVGSIIASIDTTVAPPTGWLDCDGTAVDRTTYAALFALIGETYGVGDGSTTFNLPNQSRRVLVGRGGAGTATLANSIGSVGGEEQHTLTQAELPVNVTVSAYTNNFDNGATVGGTQRVLSDTEYGEGQISVNCDLVLGTGDAKHNNIPPSFVVRYLIKT